MKKNKLTRDDILVACFIVISVSIFVAAFAFAQYLANLC